MSGWEDEILSFWFGLDPRQWWSDKSLDAQIRKRFHALWAKERQCPPEQLLRRPRAALAATILFDQFPRNMFRGHADQFATDRLALAVARGALDRGWDEQLRVAERSFLYMPFQHSEKLEDQKRSLLLFTALGDTEQLRYARLHHDVIARFGRFPHRNAVLGRKRRPEEVEAGEVVPW